MWYSFTPEYIYFGGICLPENRVLLLGPFMLGECTDLQASHLRRRLGGNAFDTKKIRQYFSLTGPHNLESLQANLRLVSGLLRISSSSGEIPLLSFTWNLPYQPLPLAADSLPEYNSPTETFENELIACIYSGNIMAMNRLLSENIEASPTAFPLPLNSMRSFILSASMLASRTALSAGVSYSLVQTMHGQYTEHILKAHTAAELSTLFSRFLQDYTEKVAKLKELPSNSPIVKFVQQYVCTQYASKITPHILADKLNMSCPYLCSHFKKETGMTISSYVRQEKMREARRLLKGSKYSVSQISEALAFSSESYFCAVFKKITGMTPESYRLSPSEVSLQESSVFPDT